MFFQDTKRSAVGLDNSFSENESANRAYQQLKHDKSERENTVTDKSRQPRSVLSLIVKNRFTLGRRPASYAMTYDVNFGENVFPT